MEALSIVRRCCKPLACLLVALGFVLMPSGPAEGQKAVSSEYRLKSVFLFNFARYAYWADSAETEGRPIVIGILGEDPFGSVMDEVVRGEKIDGRPLLVRRFETADQVEACNILFISKTARNQVGAVVETLRGAGTLTVGDSDDFTRRGGGIRFLMEGNRLRYEVNLKALEGAGVQLSSKLLRLAIIAQDEGAGEG